MGNVQKRIEAALVKAFEAQTKRDFPNATVVPSSFHYEEKAKDLSELLIKELIDQNIKCN